MTATQNRFDTYEESDLIARARAGDADAFETIVHRHGGRMLAVAARFFRCEHERDDAVQEAFISALRGIHGFDGQSALSTWLHRITVNACLMKLRTRGRRCEASINDLLPTFDEAGQQTHRSLAWSDDAHGAMEMNETRSQVRECIDRLPDSYRTVVMLRDIEELDTTETARRLRCSTANAKTRLHRARAALRTLLEPVLAA